MLSLLKNTKKTNINDIIYNKVKAIIALSDALNCSAFESVFTPEEIAEKIIDNLLYLSRQKIRPDIAVIAQEKGKQIEDLLF